MRRALPFLAILAALSGCLAELRCPGCANAWNAFGHDEALYAAVGNARGENTTLEGTPLRHGLPLARAELDRAWREYGLVELGWSPEGHTYGVRGIVAATGAPNVTLQIIEPARDGANASRWLGELLTPLVGAADTPRWRDAMLANRSAPTPGGASQEMPTGWTFRATLAKRPDAQSLFDALASGRAWVPEEADTANAAQVTLGEWTFSFVFPLRVLRIETTEEALHIQVNSHGRFYASYHGLVRTSEDDFHERFRGVLSARGVEGIDPGAWEWQGQRVEGGLRRARAASDALRVPRGRAAT